MNSNDFHPPSGDSDTFQRRRKIEFLWKELLGLTDFDPHLSFMDLGGDSLTANRLVSRLAQDLNIDIPVLRVFEHPTLKQFIKFIENQGSESTGPIAPPTPEAFTTEASDQDIAIVGMACRFPGAANIDEFWNNLVQGKESIHFFSREELSPEVPEELRDDPRLVRARGFIDKPYEMDAALFDIGPMEAKLIDPQQRLILETAYEALENAGHGPGTFQGKIAVYAGTEDNSYYKTEITPFPSAEKSAGRFAVMTGNEKDFVALRLAHKLNLKGPAVSVNSACSTSLVAVLMACKSLRNRECEMALAGGATVHFPTHDGYYYQEGGVFSPDGHCRPFDKDAQGTIFTDGVAVVALKRVSDAIRDRNPIVAVIKGGAVNNDGGDRVSFSAPSISGQSSCITDAYLDAGVSPDSIQFVETHGTATPMGDPIEVEALRQAFRKSTQRRQYCGLGSVKSNIGHTTTAAGVTSLIKTALALKNKIIPATLHFKSPNPRLNIEDSPFYIVDKLTEWKSENGPRRAGISSFGMGGTNSHAILEEAPEAPRSTEPSVERPFEIFPVSAKTPTARDRLLSSLTGLTHRPRDIAFTLQNGRSRYKTRGAQIHFSSLKTDSLTVQHSKTLEDPRLVFMFPGQGAQYIGMGRALREAFPEFRVTFDYCCEFLKRELGFDFQNEDLENTQFTQPALFVIEVSLGKMLLDWGIQPDIFVGHSIGEFAAAYLAGVFSLEDGLKLIAARGRLMAALPRGSMLSVRGSMDAVKKIMGDEIDVAAINSPIHCVLAGPTEKIKELQQKFEANNLPARLLHTSHAFHSSMMDGAVEPFLATAKEVQFSPPKIRIISTVTGEELTATQAMDPNYWAGHLRSTVRFSQAIQKCVAEGGNLFLEMGPRTTLSSLALQHLKGDGATAFSTLSDSPDALAELGALSTAIAKLWAYGYDVPWNKIWGEGNRVPLPTYPFERKSFRFSENRKPELITSAIARNTDQTTPVVESQLKIQNENPLFTQIETLLTEHSGLSIETKNTTFFESGFDSLVLMQIGVELGKRYGISIGLKDLMNTHNTLERLNDYIAKTAAPEKQPQSLKKQASALITSDAQRQLFNSSQISTDASRAMNHSICIVLEGKAQVEALRSSLVLLTQRHAALRTTFSPNGEQIIVNEKVTFEIPVLDWSGLSESQQADEYAQFVNREVHHVFDLVQGPLFTSTLIRFSGTKTILAFNCHHSVVDGWSLNIIMRDLPKLYRSVISGSNGTSLPAPLSFVEYLGETVAREKEASQEMERFWKKTFSDGVPQIQIPIDQPRSSTRTYHSRREDYKIRRDAYEKLKSIGTQNELSQFAILLSTFALYLHRITGQLDLVIGVPSAGQIKSGKPQLLVSDVRILPIRCQLQTGDNLITYARRVMEKFYAAYEHQWISQDDLVRVIFNFDPGMKPEDLHFEGLKSHHIYNPRDVEKFEISINAVVENDDMLLECAYNTDLFEADKMHHRLTELDEMMASIAENPLRVLEQAQPSQETPFFFGPIEKQMFGTFYSGKPSANFAVLICPPLGQEYMRTHWLIRNIASSLNRKGAPVMRFDFYGQGDSSGETRQARLNDITGSLIHAAQELRTRSGQRQIQLIAFRASALVAEHCRAKLGPDVKLIYIDPPQSGAEYIQQLRKVQSDYWTEAFYHRNEKIRLNNSQYEELIGTVYSQEYIRELLNLRGVDAHSGLTLSISPSAGWSDHHKFDNIFLSPGLLRELQSAVFEEVAQ